MFFFNPFSLVFFFIIYKVISGLLTPCVQQQGQGQSRSGGHWQWTPWGMFWTSGDAGQQGPYGNPYGNPYGQQGGYSNAYGGAGKRNASSGQTGQYGASQAPKSAYEILGLSPSASVDEIKKHYRELISRYHPDKFSGMKDPDFTKLAEQKFQQVQGAYEDLKKARGF